MSGASGFYDESDVLLQLAKQASFGTLGTSGLLIPIKEGSTGPKFDQDLKPNEARFQDGVARKSVFGLPNNGAELPLNTNLAFLGYPLYGFLGSMAETTVVTRLVPTNGGGSGYADGPVVITVAAPGGGGTTATFTATAAGGKVGLPVQTNEGSGYTLGTPPVVTAAAPGGGGTTATFTAIVMRKHSGKIARGTIPFYTIEEGIGTDFYVYPNQVFSEHKLEFDIEGVFDPSFTTMGGGDPVGPYASSIDSTPTEVAGAPASKLNWATIEDGVASGIITKASLNFKRSIIKANPSGKLGVATDLWGGSIEVTGTVTVLFKGDTRLAQARNGTTTSQKFIISRGDDLYAVTIPEAQAKPKTEIKKQKDKPLEFDLEISGVYDTNASSPAFFELYNSVTTHATT